MAVRYVCAFGLNDKFQPASLLQDFFKHAEEKSNTLCENGNNSVNTKVCLPVLLFILM